MTDPCNKTTDHRWLGWAVDQPGQLLYVQYGGDEAEAWRVALGWPSAEEIAHAKRHGARAFPVEIREVVSRGR